MLLDCYLLNTRLPLFFLFSFVRSRVVHKPPRILGSFVAVTSLLRNGDNRFVRDGMQLGPEHEADVGTRKNVSRESHIKEQSEATF